MKKTYAGIFVLCIIVGIIAAINFTTPPTLKKAPPPEKPAHVAEDQGEAIIDRSDVSQDITIQPANSPGPEETAVSTTGESIPSKIVINPLTFHYKEAISSPAEIVLPKLESHIIAGQRDPQSIETASHKPLDSRSGLLTDTGETEENQLLDPQSVQVTARNTKREKTMVERPRIKLPSEKEGGSETATVSDGTYPFSILLETLDNQANAERAVAHYRKRHLASFWVKVDLGNSGLKYRLFTGMFPNIASAKTYLIRHHLKGKSIKKASYTARIGIFHDKKELDIAINETTKAGAFPYTLGAKNGPIFLYVGAFYSAEGAENQCRELEDKGLPCKAAPRSTLP